MAAAASVGTRRLAGGLAAAGGVLFAAARSALCERQGSMPTAFDPEALERGAKALREINQSEHAKRVLEIAKQQEVNKQQELKTAEAQAQAVAAQHRTELERVSWEERRKLSAEQAQQKAQMKQYEDELARKRAQSEHEQQRARNAELVTMQEESARRTEALKRATEEKIQAEARATAAYKAELERENLRAKALAEGEARALEAKASEDVTRRLMLARVEAETSKALSLLRATLDGVGQGARALLTDRQKMSALVVGATLLAGGVYGAREGARFGFRHLEKILGQPALVRETSRAAGWRRLFGGAGAGAGGVPAAGDALSDVVLEPMLLDRVRQLAASTTNTRANAAPFRNMLFYGPPGTGKTMVAKRMAKYSGLDYAVMTGGDVAPLGSAAVTKIHEMFDWAATTRRGLLLFIDEADAFLAKRGGLASEEVRSALNALLYRTGTQSRDIVLVLATNRPEDLDAAVLDRMDESLEFPLPGEAERRALVALYFDKYIRGEGAAAEEAPRGGVLGMGGGRGGGAPPPIAIAPELTDAVFDEVARKTAGFSGRELAKLMAGVQAAVYGSRDRTLTEAVMMRVVDYKVGEHAHRAALVAGRLQQQAAAKK